MGKFVLKRPRIISKKFPRVDSHIDGVTKSLEGLVFSYSKQVDRALQKKHLMMLLSSMVLLLVLGSFISPKGKADSVIFHPASCLGGWVNPKNADGNPETTSNTDEESFTKDNSAILPMNTKADMYCGNFTGEAVKNTKPTKILISLAWTKGKNIAFEEKIVGNSFASSSRQILDSASTTETSFTLSSSTVEGNGSTTATTSVQSEVVSTTSPSVVNTVIDAIQNVVDKIFSTSDTSTSTNSVPQEKKQEVQPVPVTPEVVPQTPPTEVAPQAPATPQPEPPVSFIDSLVHRIAMHIIFPVYAEEIVSASSSDDSTPTSTTTENASTTELVATTTTITSTSSTPVAIDPESDDQATNNFLEVLYTFDGVTWNSLGKVNELSMKYRTFEIPATATTSWNDMTQLQIKIERLDRMDDTPTVYLDGMQLEVLYETPVVHAHPDFARDTILKDKSDDGVRVISIINSDTNAHEIWYTTITEQGDYGVAPGSWAQVDLDQNNTSYRLVDIYGENLFWVDDLGKMLWVKNLLKGSSDGIAIIPAVSTTTIIVPASSSTEEVSTTTLIVSTTTVSFTKATGEEWAFEYNDVTKVGLAKIKK